MRARSRSARDASGLSTIEGGDRWLLPARSRAVRDESGLSTIEIAVLMPVLLLLALLPVQAALWWHANQAAEVAADEALDAAQALLAQPADGQAAARAILGQAGNLRDVTVSVVRSSDVVTVDISGRLDFSVFPGGWTVSAHAEGPVERFVDENERGGGP